MEEILHLFITNICNHDCRLCCNKFYNIEEIPVVTVERLKTVDTVCLTGGDPLYINPIVLRYFIANLRLQYDNIKQLYIYTSGLYLMRSMEALLWGTKVDIINGISIAPKDVNEWLAFRSFYKLAPDVFNKGSNRLYVFKEQEKTFNRICGDLTFVNIDVISRIWDRVFNTPDNEHFERLPILF